MLEDQEANVGPGGLTGFLHIETGQICVFAKPEVLRVIIDFENWNTWPPRY